MFLGVAFISVFHPVELEQFNNAVLRQLIERGIDRGQAERFYPFPRLPPYETRPGMRVFPLYQYITYGKPLRRDF